MSAEGAKGYAPNLSGKRTEQENFISLHFLELFIIERLFLFLGGFMEKFLKDLEAVIGTINSYLADYILVVLLIGVGLFYTIRTRFVQVRCFGQGMKKVFGGINLKGDKHKGGMSSFQAFTTAVAAQVGTGNIVGASGAILLGGPGAIFWMWIIAFLGMATIYAEAVLAQKTKIVGEDGSVSGGPVYYIRKAFKGKLGKFLAGFFAVAVIISLGFVGSMVQSNAISSAVATAGGFDYTKWGWTIGIVVSVLAVLIFVGGAKRIASVTEKIVPIMAVVYLLGGLIVLGFNATVIPEALWMIIKFAFTPQAVIGGSVGYALKSAVSMGAKRGLFSNEAGMGSTPHAHAQARVDTAHEQGVSAMISVFIDTFVVLTMTALIIVTSLYAGDGAITKISNDALANGTSVIDAVQAEGYSADTLVSLAISSLFGGSAAGNIVGSVFVAVCLTFFAFSTIVSWNLFGRINFEYLFGKKAISVYFGLCGVFILLGSLLSNGLVWNFNDLFNYLMVIPNALALLALSSTVVKEVKTFGKRRSATETPNQALDEKLEK